MAKILTPEQAFAQELYAGTLPMSFIRDQTMQQHLYDTVFAEGVRRQLDPTLLAQAMKACEVDSRRCAFGAFAAEVDHYRFESGDALQPVRMDFSRGIGVAVTRKMVLSPHTVMLCVDEQYRILRMYTFDGEGWDALSVSQRERLVTSGCQSQLEQVLAKLAHQQRILKLALNPVLFALMIYPAASLLQ